MRKAFLIVEMGYIDAPYYNTVFHHTDADETTVFVRGDLQDKYAKGSIVILKPTKEVVPGTNTLYPLYYWKEVTD